MTQDGGEAASAGAVSDRGFRFAVEVYVDGRPLPLKAFVHDMIGGAATGLVAGLKGAGEPRELRIEVRRL
jgi:hypothetical protein